MHNIEKLVRENRDEAFSKLKELGGTIDFNMEQVVEEEDLDDVPYWVVVTESEQLTDVAVLSIYIDKSENGERILFFGAHRDDCGEFHVFPYFPSECSGTFENEIYIAIDEAYKKFRKAEKGEKGEKGFKRVHVLFVVDEEDNTKNTILATEEYNTESLRKLLEDNVHLFFGETKEEIPNSLIKDLCEGKQVTYHDYTAFYEDIILV